MTDEVPRGRFAVVLTHNRPELLDECVAALRPQVDRLLVIDNASDPPVEARDEFELVRVADQPPNLAALMNHGLDYFAARVPRISRWLDVDPAPEPTAWDVAVVCDDVAVPSGWFAAVTAAMRQFGAVAGCSGARLVSGTAVLKTTPDSDIANRMQGAAFILASETRLRADERMRWWWQDTDLDWQARGAGGMVNIAGWDAVNSRPNEFTYSIPGLGEQAGRDGEVFAAKWGGRPW